MAKKLIILFLKNFLKCMITFFLIVYIVFVFFRIEKPDMAGYSFLSFLHWQNYVFFAHRDSLYNIIFKNNLFSFNNPLIISFTIIISSLLFTLISGILIAFFLIIFRHKIIFKYCEYIIYFFSATPVFLIAVFLETMYYTSLYESEKYFLKFICAIFALSIGDAALFDTIRFIKTETLEILNKNFFKVIKMYNGSIIKHLFKNFLLLIFNLITSRIAYLLSGIIIVESIFNIQGLGYYLWNHAKSSYTDKVVVINISLFFIFIVLICEMFTKFIYNIIDSRKL